MTTSWHRGADTIGVMETETTTLLAGAAVALGALGLLLALLALRRAGAAKRALGELMSEGEATTGGRQMAKALAGVADHAARLAVSEGRLTELDDIGGTIAAKVDELLATGTMAALEKLRAVYPDGLVEMMRVPGVGPKTAKRLHTELGIDSIEALKAACEAGFGGSDIHAHDPLIRAFRA